MLYIIYYAILRKKSIESSIQYSIRLKEIYFCSVR